MRSGRLILISSVLFFQISAANAYTISDGFEAKALSPIWDTRKISAGALCFQSEVVREGQSAVRMTLMPGDHFERDEPTELPSERDELVEARHFESVEGGAYAYSFSLFIPRDFPIVPTRLVVAQWKQRCSAPTCVPDNPVIAVRYQDGRLTITQQRSDRKVVLFESEGDLQGQWLDLSFHIKFSRNHDGLIRAWMNQVPVVDYRGPVAFSSGGYQDTGQFYFKWGLYRDQMIQPMTIYLDEYVKELLSLNEYPTAATSPRQ